MPKIFESPDGGKTVFEREIGDTQRQKVNDDTFTINISDPMDNTITMGDTTGIFSVSSPSITLEDTSIWTKYPDLQSNSVRENLGVDVIHDIKKIIDDKQ